MNLIALTATGRKYLEQGTWLAALAVLYLMEPGGPSLCLFKAVGLSQCPGCGMGTSVHYALHGQFGPSLDAHWLGIPATAVILLLIVKPFFQSYKKHTQKNEPATAYDVTGHTAG
jgi:threonine/homoserine efflux transporter RhtA